MKTYIPIALAAALAVIAFAVIYFTTESLQSPQDALFAEIDQEIEKAQRMLNAYEPEGDRLLAGVDFATTQPLDYLPEEEWGKHLDYESFEERFRQEDSKLRSLRADLARLTGEDGPQPSRSIKPFDQLQRELQAKGRRIAEALKIVNNAVNMRKEVGDTTIRGTSHPSATSLQAILLLHQADLFRRQAAPYRQAADLERDRVDQFRRTCRELETLIASIEVDLGSAARGPVGADKPAPPTPGEEQPGRRSLFGSLIDAFVRGVGEPADEAPVEDGDGAPAEPEPEVIVALSVPERLSGLKEQRDDVAVRIQAVQAKVDDLSGQIEGLESQLADAQAEAAQARHRMLALADAGVEPADQGAMERFLAEYEAASKVYREAGRRVTLIEQGGLLNARPDTDDIAEVASEAVQVVPIDPNQDIEPRRGLVSLRAEFEANQNHLEALKAVDALLETQMAELGDHQRGAAKELENLQAYHRQNVLQASESARRAMSFMMKARGFETAALKLLTDEGIPAAENAGRAARQGYIAEISSLIVPDETGGPSRSALTKGIRQLGGHARTIRADVELLQAEVLAQQLADVERQYRMLRDAETMGIRLRADDVRDDGDGQDVPPHLFDVQAAPEAIAEVRSQAIEAAGAAMASYKATSADLNDLWVLHANIAAVQYLLANLHTGAEADAYRQQAVDTYVRALKETRDRPDARVYEAIVADLGQSPPQ